MPVDGFFCVSNEFNNLKMNNKSKIDLFRFSDEQQIEK